MSLAASLGLKLEKPFQVSSSRQTWLTSRARRLFVLKSWAPRTDEKQLPYPILAHRLLLSMRGGYSRLILPEYICDGHSPSSGWYVLLGHIEGQDFRDRWHYFKADRRGGLKIEPAHVDLVLELMKDLRCLPTEELLSEGLKKITDKIAIRVALRRLREMVKGALISNDDGAMLESAILSLTGFDDPRRPAVVSNGDFRFLNLLELSPSRTAIIDWDGAQASTFETENSIAYNWLLLWKRPDLQNRLICGAKEMFSVDRDVFRSVLLIRSVMQAQVCRKFPDQLALHVAQAVRVLDDRGFASIWNSSHRHYDQAP